MRKPLTELRLLLRELGAVRHPGVYLFCSLPDSIAPPASAIATFRESEGLSIVIEESEAFAHGLIGVFRTAWITLTVNSALSAVGLSATVARALAEAGISCNIVAATYHDHLFVPDLQAEAALNVLARLQQTA